MQKSKEFEQFSANLKHLHRLTTTNYENFDVLFAEYLKTGCEIFGLPTGVIGEIVDNLYIIRSVQSEIASLVPGLVFAVEDTYCGGVAKEKKTIAYTKVGELEGMQAHPLYQKLKLETYISTPIFVNGEVYGTLNFSSTGVRNTDFQAHSLEIIELMAQSIGRFIAAEQAEKERQRAIAQLQRSQWRSQLFAEISLKIPSVIAT